MLRLFLFVLLSFALTAAQGEERIVLLGGGTDPASSEVSIEKNVAWIASILESRGFDNYEVMFASGTTDPTLDVKTNRWDSQINQDWLPLARVFGNRKILFEAYHKNTVARSPLPNTSTNALALLGNIVGSMETGDNLLLIYNGHGGRGKPDTDLNHLRLWNRSKLTVEDLVEVLQKQKTGTKFRFVLPQCYSGPFLKVIHQHLASDDYRSINTNRCGFVTVPHYRRSEGCTVLEDEADYRDYSSFFFAALDGKTRLGQALSSNPDRNDDGRTDMSEAHFYATLEAYSRSVPRSTSEYFLEQWQPWYLRWQSYDQVDDAVDDDYADIARLLALKLGQAESTGRTQLLRTASRKRSVLEHRISQVEDNIESMERQEAEIRGQLQRAALMHWPELRNAYSVAYKTMAYQRMSEISIWLQEQEPYGDLESIQEQIDEADKQLLELERDQGMQMRILRFLELSRLYHLMYRFGSDEAIEDYEKLRRCEAWNGIAGHYSNEILAK